ncbi:MAG: hypothetical protein ACRD1C_13295 [Terriglobales bacterium]
MSPDPAPAGTTQTTGSGSPATTGSGNPPATTGPGNSLTAALNTFDQALQAFVLALGQDLTSPQGTPPQPATGQPAQPGNPAATAFGALGQDLQSGNLSAAQQDFATLQQNLQQGPQGFGFGPGSQSQGAGNSSLVQAFNTLGQALQSGDLGSAQQDFATLQQDMQQGSQVHGGRHHHHSSGSEGNSAVQTFNSLAQALQSGNLSAAQNAYSTLQQDLEPSSGTTPAPGTTTLTSPPTSSNLNVAA